MNKKIIVEKNQEKIVPFIWLDSAKPGTRQGKQNNDQINYYVDLAAEGASVHLVGLFLGTDRSQLRFNTDVIHTAPNTFSRTTLRGVFLDNSSISNDGMIRIRKGAKGADGYFSSKILLFDDAKGRSVPSLEIDENELKAGHASTIGRPDAEQLFYMQARGLSEKEAQKLLIAGFFEPVIRLLSKEEQIEVREKLKNYLE